MADYITLMGAEQVQSAARRMSEAADAMRSAASAMDDVFFRHQRFLDDWLQRFETVIGPVPERMPTPEIAPATTAPWKIVEGVPEGPCSDPGWALAADGNFRCLGCGKTAREILPGHTVAPDPSAGSVPHPDDEILF